MVRINIYQMYMENDCKFGFFITRDSWREDRYAVVFSIDGVEDGKPIEGNPPYFSRYYPSNHSNAGKVWPRVVCLKAPWFDTGEYYTESGGTYTWTRVNPAEE